MSDLKRVALHEAGHAVMHVIAGEPVACATVHPDSDGENLGSVRRANSVPVSGFFEHVCMCLAGAAAENIHDGLGVPNALSDLEVLIDDDVGGRRSDWEKAWADAFRCIGYMGLCDPEMDPPDDRQYELHAEKLVEAYQHCISQLRENWSAVLLVQELLITEGTVQGKAIHNAVVEASNR